MGKDTEKDKKLKEKDTQSGKSKKQEKAPEKEDKSPERELLDLTKKELAELNDKLSKEHDDYLRLMAEFETFRRRYIEERKAIVSTAAADTIKGLLPVLDDCERAMKMLETSSDASAKEGTSLIYNKLLSYLKGQGLEIIDAKGKEFDTDFHEAVTQFPAPSPELKGKVVDVLQTGYLLNGKVIRYAKVVVGV